MEVQFLVFFPLRIQHQLQFLEISFQTPHDVSISNLRLAHRVRNMLVQTKQDLESALVMSQEGQLDWVIEIESHIEDNTAYHRVLQQSARDAVNHAFKMISNYS